MEASNRKIQTWIKALALLLIAALVFCSVSAFSSVTQASAAPQEQAEEAYTADQIAGCIGGEGKLFPDKKFAAVVADALYKAGKTYSSLYENDSKIKTTVKSLDCIGLDASGKGITSIQGIRYLTSVTDTIDLSSNSISDLSPICLGSSEKYQCSFNFESNPISNWPNDTFEAQVGTKTYTDIIFKTKRNATALNITNSYAFAGTAQYIYGTTDIVQYLNYGVTTGEEYLWSESVKPSLQVLSTTGTATMQTETPTVDYRAKVTNIASNVSYLIAANTIGVSAIRACDFTVPNYEHQDISYSWQIDTKFFANVTATVQAKSAGTVTVVKTDSTGEVNIPGAVFRLYNSDKTTVAKDVNGIECPDVTTDETGTVVWEGIPNGTYYVQEVKAPAGFERDKGYYAVTVNVAEAQVTSSSFTFEGGETVTTPEGEVNGIMVTSTEETWSPQWSEYSSAAEVNPLVTTGSAALSEGLYITNGGEKIISLSITTDLDRDPSLTATDTYTLTIDGTEVTVDKQGNPFTAESALAYINNLVDSETLTGNIVLNRSVVYTGASQGTPDPSVTTVADTPLPVSFTPAILKQVKNDTLVAGAYSFAMYDELGTQLEVVTNDGDGLAVFEKMTFEEAGVYNYTIRELKPSEYGQEDDEAITYDVTPRKVKVTVTEAFGSTEKAGLKAVITVDDKEVATLYSSQTTTYDKAGQITTIPADPIQLAKITNKKVTGPLIPGTGDSFPMTFVVILSMVVVMGALYFFFRKKGVLK